MSKYYMDLEDCGGCVCCERTGNIVDVKVAADRQSWDILLNSIIDMT